MHPRFSQFDLATLKQLSAALDALPAPSRYTELMDAILHHTLKFSEGEEFDRETGVHHVAAVMAYAYQLNSNLLHMEGIDNRSEVEPKGVKLVWDKE